MSCHLSGTSLPRRAPLTSPHGFQHLLLTEIRERIHRISIHSVSTPTGRRKGLPNCSCPDRLVLDSLARRPLLLNRKEAPTRKRRRPYVIAFLADWYTV